MIKADLIVNALLEDDGDDLDPASYIEKIAAERQSGDISVYNADDYHYFYHRTKTYADGHTPIQVRRNGRTKRWKTRPNEFQIPVKYGLKDCFYITQHNAGEWSTIPPEHPKPVKKKAKRRAALQPAPVAAPERPAPIADMSPQMYKEWEKEQQEKEMRVPRPPREHPELPL